jgi:UDP-3-O-acyl-N-acetylglucosamine deacetylase
MGILPKAHILAYKASHTLHTQLVQRLLHLQ